MSRDICMVIARIMEHIPRDDPSTSSLLVDLNEYTDKLMFVPPERMSDSYQYNRLLPILVKHLGKTPPTYGWKKDVYDIWMDNK